MATKAPAGVMSGRTGWAHPRGVLRRRPVPFPAPPRPRGDLDGALHWRDCTGSAAGSRDKSPPREALHPPTGVGAAPEDRDEARRGTVPLSGRGVGYVGAWPMASPTNSRRGHHPAVWGRKASASWAGLLSGLLGGARHRALTHGGRSPADGRPGEFRRGRQNAATRPDCRRQPRRGATPAT